MEVEARSTSMTRTVDVATAARSRPSGVTATSMRTLSSGGAQRADLEAERVQVDEALGIALPVDRVGLERREVRAVERARRAASGHRSRCLVELEPDRPRHVLRALVHQRLEARRSGANRSRSRSSRVAGHEPVAQVQHLAIEVSDSRARAPPRARSSARVS